MLVMERGLHYYVYRVSCLRWNKYIRYTLQP